MTEYRARIEEINARHPVKMWIALAVLLVLLVGVQQVGAYVYDFQNASEINDFSAVGSASGTTTATPYPDVIAASFSYGSGFEPKYMYHEISYPTNYWAYTVISANVGSSGFGIFNDGLSLI